jgi:hypothetical protein
MQSHPPGLLKDLLGSLQAAVTTVNTNMLRHV